MENEKLLIDKNALEEEVSRTKEMSKAMKNNFTAHNVVACIKNAPTVDAVEVVHASWIEDGYYGNPFVCSHCGREGCYSGDFKNKQYYYTNYCPNCGAKMDGGNEDA